MSALTCGRCRAAAPKPRAIGAPVLCEACQKLRCRCGDLVAYSPFADAGRVQALSREAATRATGEPQERTRWPLLADTGLMQAPAEGRESPRLQSL